jgi:hypothetical protein
LTSSFVIEKGREEGKGARTKEKPGIEEGKGEKPRRDSQGGGSDDCAAAKKGKKSSQPGRRERKGRGRRVDWCAKLMENAGKRKEGEPVKVNCGC